MNARISGVETVGEITTALQDFTPLQRKTLTDRIRKRLGFEDECRRGVRGGQVHKRERGLP
jgi:hypothetical protein